MSGPTPHFTWDEFACGDGTEVPAALRPNTEHLCRQLEVLRADLGGRPIEIVSGYRTRDWNRKVGGAPDSQHMQAKAADIAVAGLSDLDIWCAAKRLRESGQMAGRAGWYNNGRTIHVDVSDLNDYFMAPATGFPECPEPPAEEDDVDEQARADIARLKAKDAAHERIMVVLGERDKAYAEVMRLLAIKIDAAQGTTIAGRLDDLERDLVDHSARFAALADAALGAS
jgi:hypothetical protein